MRTIFALSFFILVLFTSCCQQEKSPLEGTWEMVSGTWTLPDSTVFEYPGNIKEGSQLFMYSKDYYLFSGRFKMDTIFHDNYGGGTYKYGENKYEETLLYFVDSSSIGQTLAFQIDIKNDTLIKTGPLGDDAKKFGNTLVEVYIRKD
jgi:hypothetical protein